MKKTLIVADDNKFDRSLLRALLQEQYRIIEAVDGQELLQIIGTESTQISAILMDIFMPVIDGYEALKVIRAHKESRNIPVVVISSEHSLETKKKAVEYGANGFISKPFEPYLVEMILDNVISYRESLTLLGTLSKDKLTGLISHELFFDECDKLIQSHEPGYYILSCIDIDQFKVINDQYGMDVGDQVIKHIADCISICYQELNGLACRYNADRFAVLYPAALANTSVIFENHKSAVNPPCIKHSIRLRIGRYLVTDLSTSSVMMYERATVAEESIKGRYDVYIAEYDDSMRTRILQEQEIVVEMEEALNNGQFIPYLQPQFNHANGALIGAEVLVRWKKEERLIAPAEFIPIFEKNGFIYKMDCYIWEQACILLRKWIDEGKQPLPISVNVSRIDLYKEDLVETISKLVEQYRLSVDLLRIEVTESAFIDSPEHIVKVVNRLIRYGFTVEIDDFGSGYSSLNTLKDVQATILKLDMKFFSDTENAARSGNIIESVVRMAKWLGMAVIAEGVERPEQADYLKSIGCYYVQGYLYARPMTAEEYEKLQDNSLHEKKLTRLKTVSTLDNDQFWNPDSMETLIFNSYIGGACIIEHYKGQLEVLRINDRYLIELGSILSDEMNLTAMNPSNYLDSDNLFLLNHTILEAITSKSETCCELKLIGSEHEAEYIRYSVRLIATTKERNLLYCVVQNMTEQRITERKLVEAELKEIESAQRLKVIMDNVNGGVSAILLHPDRTSKFIFCNDRYFELYGYTRAQAEEEKLDILTKIVPEDLAMFIEKTEQMKKNRQPVIIEYQVMKRDGSYALLRSMSSVMRMAEYGNDVITAVVSDITEEKNVSEQLKFLNDSAHDILAQPDTRLAINGTLKKLLDYFHSDRSYVIELNYSLMTLSNTYEVCAENVTSEMENLQGIPFTYQEFWYKKLSNNDCVIIEDVDKLPNEENKTKRLLQMQNIQSLIFVSLMRDGELIGFLGVDNSRKRINQTERLKAISDYIAILLTRRDLNQSIERSNDEINQLINDTPGGFCRMAVNESRHLTIISMNEGFCKMLQMSESEVKEAYGDDMYTCLESEDIEAFMKEYKTSLAIGGQFSAKCRLRLKTGEYLWTMVIGRIIKNQNGNICVNAYFTDIADQMRREERGNN